MKQRRQIRLAGRPSGCVKSRNRSQKCLSLCAPQNGTGECGRIAPHALEGRTDKAIRNYARRSR
ncbi:MAG: hypothetical protein AB1714_09650 [Acidobacteriota bacterium]